MHTYPPFIQNLKEVDEELFKIAAANQDLSMAPGALDLKTKFLILLAADIMAGSSGVKGIAQQARSLGASEMEIRETVRIACLVAGNKAMHTGIAAL